MNEQKREIRALEYVACDLVAKLDTLFCHFKWWDVGHGLDLVIKPYANTSNDKVVIIRPVGWQQLSHIGCRFEERDGTWRLMQGQITALHLDDESFSANFFADYGGNRGNEMSLRFEGVAHPQKG